MMEEIFGWIGGLLALIFIIVPVIVGVIWKFVCLFRCSGHWKGCPLRCKEPSCGVKRLDDLSGKGCRKCPFPLDEQEKQDYLDKLQGLYKLVDLYAEKNQKN